MAQHRKKLPRKDATPPPPPGDPERRVSPGARRRRPEREDPILKLRGDGRDIWADEAADDYVRRLRDDWK